MPAPVTIGHPATPTPAILPSQIDRYGYLDARYLEAKKWLDERETLKKVIQEHSTSAPADQPVRLEGKLYVVDLGLRENKRAVTNKARAFAALRKVLGMSGLTEALSYTLKLLDEHVPEASQTAFVSTERTGPRSIRSVIKAAPAA